MITRHKFVTLIGICLLAINTPKTSVAQEVQERNESQASFSIPEQLSGGSLSPENKLFIEGIMQKLDIKTSIKFRRTLESFSEHHAAFKYIFTSPLLGYCYINEPWFDTL